MAASQQPADWSGPVLFQCAAPMYRRGLGLGRLIRAYERPRLPEVPGQSLTGITGIMPTADSAQKPPVLHFGWAAMRAVPLPTGDAADRRDNSRGTDRLPLDGGVIDQLLDERWAAQSLSVPSVALSIANSLRGCAAYLSRDVILHLQLRRPGGDRMDTQIAALPEAEVRVAPVRPALLLRHSPALAACHNLCGTRRPSRGRY
jgi:hypothetical protein